MDVRDENAGASLSKAKASEAGSSAFIRYECNELRMKDT